MIGEILSVAKGISKVKTVGKVLVVASMIPDLIGEPVPYEIAKKYDSTENFFDGFAHVKFNGKWGVIDITGTEITPIKYDSIDKFNDGLARVELNEKWGIIDSTGKEITPIKYDSIDEFKNGFARVKRNKKWEIIDTTGKTITPIKYDVIGTIFENGFARVKLNGKWGIIDIKGKDISSIKYDSMGKYSKNGDYISVELNGKWGFIDKTGKEVSLIKYDSVGNFQYPNLFSRTLCEQLYSVHNFYPAIACVKLNNKWGLIAIVVEKKKLEPLQEEIDMAMEIGIDIISMYKERYKQDIIESFKGEIGEKTIPLAQEVTPIKYDFIENFEGNLAFVKLNGKWGIIQKTINSKTRLVKYDNDTKLGKLNEEKGCIISLTPMKYDLIGQFDNLSGKAPVQINGKWGLINKKGEEITPIKYDSIDNDYSYAQCTLNGKIDYIDNKGIIYDRGFWNYIERK